MIELSIQNDPVAFRPVNIVLRCKTQLQLDALLALLGLGVVEELAIPASLAGEDYAVYPFEFGGAFTDTCRSVAIREAFSNRIADFYGAVEPGYHVITNSEFGVTRLFEGTAAEAQAYCDECNTLNTDSGSGHTSIASSHHTYGDASNAFNKLAAEEQGDDNF